MQKDVKICKDNKLENKPLSSSQEYERQCNLHLQDCNSRTLLEVMNNRYIMTSNCDISSDDICQNGGLVGESENLIIPHTDGKVFSTCDNIGHLDWIIGQLEKETKDLQIPHIEAEEMFSQISKEYKGDKNPIETLDSTVENERDTKVATFDFNLSCYNLTNISEVSPSLSTYTSIETLLLYIPNDYEDSMSEDDVIESGRSFEPKILDHDLHVLTLLSPLSCSSDTDISEMKSKKSELNPSAANNLLTDCKLNSGEGMGNTWIVVERDHVTKGITSILRKDGEAAPVTIFKTTHADACLPAVATDSFFSTEDNFFLPINFETITDEHEYRLNNNDMNNEETETKSLTKTTGIKHQLEVNDKVTDAQITCKTNYQKYCAPQEVFCQTDFTNPVIATKKMEDKTSQTQRRETFCYSKSISDSSSQTLKEKQISSYSQTEEQFETSNGDKHNDIAETIKIYEDKIAKQGLKIKSMEQVLKENTRSSTSFIVKDLQSQVQALEEKSKKKDSLIKKLAEVVRDSPDESVGLVVEKLRQDNVRPSDRSTDFDIQSLVIFLEKGRLVAKKCAGHNVFPKEAFKYRAKDSSAAEISNAFFYPKHMKSRQ